MKRKKLDLRGKLAAARAELRLSPPEDAAAWFRHAEVLLEAARVLYAAGRISVHLRFQMVVTAIAGIIFEERSLAGEYDEALALAAEPFGARFSL